MANNLTRYNPVREMLSMRDMVDRLFDDNWRPFFEEGPVGANALALDVVEDDQQYRVTTELPGVKPDDIRVRQEGDYLVIEAETRDETETNPQEGQRPVIKERRYGHYSRRLRLPQRVDFDAAEATYEDGVLKLTLPKSAETQPRTIPVRTGRENGSQS